MPLAADQPDISAVVSQLLAADDPATWLGPAVEDLLQTLRQRLQLDVVFVAEFVDGRRILRFVDRSPTAPPVPAGHSDPLEASACQRVVDGRLPGYIANLAELPPDADVPPLPFPIGTHLSAPVVLKDGSTFGTLCCFSCLPSPVTQSQDVELLRHCARLVARKLERAAEQGRREMPPSWSHSPGARYASSVWQLRGSDAVMNSLQKAWLDS